MAAIPKNVSLWPCRRIAYTFEPGYPYEKAVRKLMDKWEEATGVAFRKRVNESNYLMIKKPSGSSNSHVGMKGGEQVINIGNDYIGLHELGHALGLIHEQSRNDRDTYINIQWNNISGGASNINFIIYTSSDNLTDYDLKSVMHYPAPAKGWCGNPSDQEVWTMRWKADNNVKLGGGAYQGWSNLSALDKVGLRKVYNNVIVPMGEETDHGSWHNPYKVQFPFTIGNRVFFYGQNMCSNNWFIQELLPNGKMGSETDHGSWHNPYEVQFPFTIGNRVFFYGQNMCRNNWFIQELLPNGKMGSETDHGSWHNSYEVQFPFTIGNRVFFYGENMSTNNWFIQELLPNGKMGSETDHGTWNIPFEVQFPFTIGNRVFFYGQNMCSNNWTIQELLSNGIMGRETDNGSWNNAYAVQFPYNIGGKQYFYGQNLHSNYWFIQRLNANGTMGEELQGGFWHNPYDVQFSYNIDGKQYFYGQNLESYNWFIQNLQNV